MNQVDNKPKLTEDERILGTQLELFSLVTPEEKQDALAILKSYPEIESRVKEFKKYETEIMDTILESERIKRLDEDELYANRPANAVIMAMNQKKAYDECTALKRTIEMAVGCIVDQEARDAVYYRYLKGFSYKETLSFMRRGVKSSTVDRRLHKGIDSVANTLKMWRVFDQMKKWG